MTEEERVRLLNRQPVRKGSHVLYWMQSAPRVSYNHALTYAVEAANKLNQPLHAFYGVTRFPEATRRHYAFLLEGLNHVQEELGDMGVQLQVQLIDPAEGAVEHSKQASVAVVDMGYTRKLKEWYRVAAAGARCRLVQVETNTVVPVETASTKEEYAAYTIRKKIHKLLPRFMKPHIPLEPARTREAEVDSIDTGDLDRVVKTLNVDETVPESEAFKGGYAEADRRLTRFTEDRLDAYDKDRNDPTLDAQSGMSPYLHFGQISPLEVALRVDATGSSGRKAYLEELIVRRELAANFVYYNPSYDSIDCLPPWCRATLQEHAGDPREYLYSLPEFENAETHDPYWNAAQREMTRSGKMHGYMRMYWGKKIIEWSRSPEEAYKAAVHLNDRYELDGRDPNGYAGVAWCFGKHDRAWKERPIYGKIRYMNDRGLRRKFDTELYLEQRK